MQYKLITSSLDRELDGEFSALITEHLEQGWAFLGVLQVIPTASSVVFAQPMIRVEKPKPAETFYVPNIGQTVN